MKNEIVKIINDVNSEYIYEADEQDLLPYIYDSLKFIEFLVLIEEKFDVSFELEDCIPENFNSISNIQKIINEVR